MLGKHGGLSLAPGTYTEAGHSAVHLEARCWEWKQAEIPRAHGLARPDELLSSGFSEKACLKDQCGERLSKTLDVNSIHEPMSGSADTQVCTQACSTPNTHTHIILVKINTWSKRKHK